MKATNLLATWAIGMLAPMFIYGQASYCDGWKAGFKDGYCYNSPGCVAAVAPPCPVPNPGERSYKDGYARGVLKGREVQTSVDKSELSGGGAYGQLRPITTNFGDIVQKTIARDRERKAYNNTQRNQNLNIFHQILQEALDAFNNKEYAKCRRLYIRSQGLGWYDSNLELIAGISYGILWKENLEILPQTAKRYLKEAKKTLKLSKKHKNPYAQIHLELLKEAEKEVEAKE